MKTVAVAFILLAVTAASAVEITVTTDPPVAAANLIANPSIEDGDGEPAAWRFGTAVPENFNNRWENTGRTGSRSLHVSAIEKVMSGYWTQAVNVQPGASYLLAGYYRTSGGRLLIFAKANYERDGVAMHFDERFYAGSKRDHWLSPVFLPPEAMTDPEVDEWVRFEKMLEIPPEVSEIAISVGSYFSPGETWFDDIYLGPATTDLHVAVDPAGAQLKSVRIIDEAGTELYVSPEGPVIIEPFEITVEDTQTQATWSVMATDTAGNETSVAYPAPGGEVQ